MELPQSLPFKAEGRQPTHDFLSLYIHSSTQQDQIQRPTSQGGHLKTHDFLQLEQLGKTSSKEETPVEVANAEKLPPPPPAPPPSVEHILPGGIGTYTVSHSNSYFYPRVPKAEGTVFTVAQGSSSIERNDESSNCSSYTGSGFTLWEESARKKGKTRKENSSGETPFVSEATGKAGQWATSSLERASTSSTNNHRNSFSFHSSQTSSKQKSQSFLEMMKSAKAGAQDDDFEEDEDFVLKKESSTTNLSKGDLRINVDCKSAADQKANTPRSKHSATEQRRRSKINDRFQMLRDIIPHSDQKRDKASFLSEVIEYIQFLQEKVYKFEGTYQAWSHKPSNLMPWRNNCKPVENYADQSHAINGMPAPALVFSAKLDEKNINVAPTIPRSVQNPIESDMSTATPFRATDLHPGMTNKTMPFPVSLQPNITSAQHTGVAVQIPPRLPSDAENNESQPQSVQRHTGSCTNGVLPSEKLKEQELMIEDGTISISSVYSQGLLNTLTQALQTSGVDLSHASISVQIELGKRTTSSSRPTPTAPTSTLKDREAHSINQGSMRSRVGCSEDCRTQPLKKLKT